MALGKAALRVSYMIPEPTHHPPCLQLPQLGVDRRGSTTPLLIPGQNDGTGGPAAPLTVASTHPRPSRSTQARNFQGKQHLRACSIYGGCDGVTIAHELGVPHKERVHMTAAGPHRWETIVGFRSPHNEEEHGPVGIPTSMLGRWTRIASNLAMCVLSSYS